jgi:peroxiredoxin Q/BCP
MSIPQVGKKAPDFTVQNDEDETVSLSDYKGQNVVLYFYPKDDTPG